MLLPLALSLFCLLCTHSVLQGQSLSGQLLDAENKEPLIGATLQIKNHTSKTVSDLDGNFLLENCPNPPFSLIISYTGYQDMTHEVTRLQDDMRLEMEAGVNLDVVEVVSEYSKLKNTLSLTVESLGLKDVETGFRSTF